MPTRNPYLWLLTIILLGATLPSGWLDVLGLKPLVEEEGRELWRVFTAHFVHINFAHALLNTIGLWLCYFWAKELFDRWVLLYIAILSFVIGVLILLYSPEELPYAGFSAVLYGLFVIGLLPRIVLLKDRFSLLAFALIFGWLLWQFFASAWQLEEALIGGEVAVMAHLYAVIIALCIASMKIYLTARQKTH